MLVNSLNFLIFFGIVFFIYYIPLKEKTKSQNWLLFVASYVFYGIAAWQMIPLLFTATTIFYFLGFAIRRGNEKKASLLTTLGVCIGVGLLLYFKYLNFFIQSFADLFNTIGLKANWGTFNIILPLGISFFTFRLISYIIEVRRGKMVPTKDFVVFANYIAFFPTIMSGPIDRPNSFIPQLTNKRTFNYGLASDGCRQIIWGMSKKMIIADNLATIVNPVWADIPNQSGSTLFITAILYSIQMYTDFSGYSDMAIGIGKILGFRITKNFNYPYFTRNVSEYWRNWHMSLTSWLTDYVFMPLNVKFRDLGNFGLILAIIINMVVVGLWHGANWTFALFGLYHGLLFIPLILSGSFFKKKKLKTNKLGIPYLKDVLKMLGTFLLVTLGLVIFRADNIGQFWDYINGFFNFSNFFKLTLDKKELVPLALFIVIMFILEWFERGKEFALSTFLTKNNIVFRWSFYFFLIVMLFVMSSKQQEFIYFQF
ncbi:MBOAT family O-acyltransferase [Algibacter aquimarinus]|uniref:MBOAT family protein n=1 Tax=Algibacter aquimarinus TaxID=1136748 RepID=A0ABP9HL55_9FLAO